MESMNPQQQTSYDYLDQIAPQTVKHTFTMNKPRLFILIGLIAIVVVIILAITVGAITSARKDPWERLAARVDATAAVANSSEGKIKNSELRSINSNVKISLTNTTRDLIAPLITADVNSKKLSKPILEQESSTKMIARLEDARLNAKYDSTYAREMNYQLSNLLTLLKQLYSTSSNEKNKTFLKATYDNFAPVQQSLAEFSASNE